MINRIFRSGETTGNNDFINTGSFSFPICFTGTDPFSVQFTTTTGIQPIIKYCIYCTEETKILCEKGACKTCHKENLCHGELKK